jgi:hypothetical protein
MPWHGCAALPCLLLLWRPRSEPADGHQLFPERRSQVLPDGQTVEKMMRDRELSMVGMWPLIVFVSVHASTSPPSGRLETHYHNGVWRHSLQCSLAAANGSTTPTHVSLDGG